jgi:hypothetical protein
MAVRATQAYITTLDIGAGKARLSHFYIAVLGKDFIPGVLVSQVYVTVLSGDLEVFADCNNSLGVTEVLGADIGVSVENVFGFTEDVPFELFVPSIPQEHISMGAVADLLAAPKSFSVPSNLSRYLEKKTNGIDPAVPAAYAAKDEVQSIAIYDGTVDGGTFTLTITLRDGTTFTTAAIAHDANAATIETAIDTASPAEITAGDIAVTGGPLTTTPVVLTFDGDSVEGDNHALTTIDGAELTGGGTAGAITATTEGQTVRNARAVLYNLGVISDATPPAQGLTTAPTKGANLLGVAPWVVRELAQEVAFEDLDNDIYQVLVVALLGYTDVAPLVAD